VQHDGITGHLCAHYCSVAVCQVIINMIMMMMLSIVKLDSVRRGGCAVCRFAVVWPRARIIRSRIRRRRRPAPFLSHSSFKTHLPGNSRRHSVECFPRSRHSTSYLHAVFRVVSAACVEAASGRTALT